VYVTALKEAERSYRGKAFFVSFRSCALNPHLLDKAAARYQQTIKKFPFLCSPCPILWSSPTGFLPKIRITCQEEIEKEWGFIETFVFRFTAVAAPARRMRLPFYRFYV
jgi:hypothetical protein